MAVARNCKEVACVAVVVFSILLAAAQCEDTTTDAVTQSSGPTSSPGLHRIKLLTSSENQNAPAVLNKRKNPEEKIEEGQKKIQMEGELENMTNNKNDHNNMAADGSQEKVSGSNHGMGSRSNSSSSAESMKLQPSTHPLFADRHHGDASGAGVLENPESDSNSEIAHEHIEKYELHQSSELDSEEDASFKAPASAVVAQVPVNAKVSDSITVSSDSFPVRLGSNSRIPENRNNNGILAIRKPLPIVRQEAVQTPVSEPHDNINDRYRVNIGL